MYYLFSENTILFLLFIALYYIRVIYDIFIENTNTKRGEKKEGKKELSRTRTQHLRLDAITHNHYTTNADFIPFPWNFRRQDDQASLTELLAVKKNDVNAYSMAMNEWKNIIMLYKLYKTTIHVLVCKVGRKTYVLLSRFPLLFWS